MNSLGIPEGSTYVNHKYEKIGKDTFIVMTYIQNGARRTKKMLIDNESKAKDLLNIGLEIQSPTVKELSKVKINKFKSHTEDVPTIIKEESYTPPLREYQKDIQLSSMDEKPFIEKKVEVVNQDPTPSDFTVNKSESMIYSQSGKRYKYQYGIRDIKLGTISYKKKAVYVSKPISVDGNAKEIELNTVETHPYFDEATGELSTRRTAIEYYIAPVRENYTPSLDEWIPILPSSEKKIQCEFLLFENKNTARLRFNASLSAGDMVVYKNDIAMDSSEWFLIDGGAAIQFEEEVDTISEYTVSYTPSIELSNPWAVEITKDMITPISQYDEFPAGADHNNRIELSKYPFVDYEEINQIKDYDPNTSNYQPFSISLFDANIVGKNRSIIRNVGPYIEEHVSTKNITNYKTDEQVQLRRYSINPDNEYPYFDYKQDGKFITFSERFNGAELVENTKTSSGNASIGVRYEYMSSMFRVKAIICSSQENSSTVSPMLSEYTLKIRTAE